MPALFEAEGMFGDALGTGLFRIAVVTEHEGKLPDVGVALGKRLVEIRLVRLVDAPMSYRPGTLKVSPNVELLYDELKMKRYKLEAGHWKPVHNEDQKPRGLSNLPHNFSRCVHCGLRWAAELVSEPCPERNNDEQGQHVRPG